MTDLTEWLVSKGFGDFAELFRAQRIEIAQLEELGDADLKEIGIAALGDRRRLLNAIASLPQATAPPVDSEASRLLRTPASERRQLTVLFADLVGSTALARSLDPEDWQAVLQAYHGAVAGAVAPFEGTVAQLLGDGVLVYFGYPRAHADDPDRAARAALAIVAAVGRTHPLGMTLQVRIGIATGAVVVGLIGAGTLAEDFSARGSTPNLAARLQQQAEPSQIVLSEETRRLIASQFEVVPLPPLAVKGIDGTVAAWILVRARSLTTRFEARQASELTSLVGRDSEIALLRERLQSAVDAEAQFVLIAGEAGIGKSRLCMSLRKTAQAMDCMEMIWQCSAYFSSTGLHPVANHLRSVAGISAEDVSEVIERKLDAACSDLVVGAGYDKDAMLHLLGAYQSEATLPEVHKPQQWKQRILPAVIELVEAISRRRPLLLLVEDAHWADPTLEELIALLVDRLRSARVLLVVTGRHDYAPGWMNAVRANRLSLGRLSYRQCGAMVDVLSGGSLPEEIREEIIAKTDGVPLFVEELTRAVLESGRVEKVGDRYRLNGGFHHLAIPETLQDLLMEQLDRLPQGKEIAQAASAIGREFSLSLLRSVIEVPTAQVEAAVESLVKSGLVDPVSDGTGFTYAFRHALIRDTAYNSMLKSQRMSWHRHIASALERRGSEGGIKQPQLIAFHYQESGQAAHAFRYFVLAGLAADARAEQREACMHYSAALELLPVLKALPEISELELDVTMKLGNALALAEGFASQRAFDCFSRCRTIARASGNLDAYVAASAGLGSTLSAAGQFGQIVRMFGDLKPAELKALSPVSRVARFERLGVAEFHRGDFARALSHLDSAARTLPEVGTEVEAPLGGAKPRVVIAAYRAKILAFQGLLERASACANEALTAAIRSQDPGSQAWASPVVAWTAMLLGDVERAQLHAKRTLELGERYGFRTRIALGSFFLGWARVSAGDIGGSQYLKDGYAMWAAASGTFHASELAGCAADALIQVGKEEEAAVFLRQAEQIQMSTEEQYVHAELLRLRARLLESSAQDVELDEMYGRAIAVANRQGAVLFALRAATDLALSSKPGKMSSAARKELLHALYRSVPENASAPDLLRARQALS